jgi:uncharacterized protein (DUF2336 family)
MGERPFPPCLKQMLNGYAPLCAMAFLHQDDPANEMRAFSADADAEGVLYLDAENEARPHIPPSRTALLKRLADVVCLPESRVNAFERAVTADLLVEMLREATSEERLKVARRLSALAEIPHSLIRLLIIDDFDIARNLIEESEALRDSDLNYVIHSGSEHHRRLIAARKNLTPILSEALVESQDIPALNALLKNMRAELSQSAIEALVVMSQKQTTFIPLLIKRPELRPSSAYILFWWAGPEVRQLVLTRFAVNREILQDMAADVFAMAASENWNDPLSRKALQFIERRQRNRAALAKSPFESLDAAIEAGSQKGLTRFIAEEIAYLSGIKPSTGAKILRDAGGEGLAVLCKATGLPKASLRALWNALRRPLTQSNGDVHPDLERVLTTFDMLATDRAQTVLRYWNWSLSSALSAALLRALSRGDQVELDTLSIPERSAMLAFAQDFET